MDAVECLIAALGEDSVLTGESIGPRHMVDYTPISPVRPLAIILPRSTDQVSAALRICNQAGQSVVPQGGMTGLSGGAVPCTQDVCLSLERMRGIEEFDPAASTMTVLAGTTLQTIQEAAATNGFDFPVDMASRGSCQIGGVLSTNGGGLHVVHSGMAREQVMGLEAVLADGTVLTSLNKMLKNNTGYDLKQLFIGSEGTLGVITRAVLRLKPRPARRHTVLCALNDYAAVLRVLQVLRESLGGELSAFEVMWPDFFEFGVSVSGERQSPFRENFRIYALLEQLSFDRHDDGRRLAEILSGLQDEGVINDAVLAQSAAESKRIWDIRDSTSEFWKRFDPINFDISLPIGRIGEFVRDCSAAFGARWPGNRALYFGHIGDSNLHVTVDANSIAGVPHEEVPAVLYSLVGAYLGSISAEHGIGLTKRKYLGISRTPAELETMRAIKRALDPRGILNPGKIFPA